MIHAFTLRRYLQLMEMRGYTTEQVLDRTGIDAERLADRGYCIEPEQRRAFIANMLALTGNPALGLEFGQHVRVSHFGAVGHVLLSSHSIWEQYRLWLQYGEPLLGLPIATFIERHGDGSWTSRYEDPTPAGPEHVFGVEELMCISNRMVHFLTGEPLQLSKARFDYPAPPHADRYPQVFGCEIEFGCSRAEMLVSSPRPEDCFPGHDEEFAQTAASYCGRLLEEVQQTQSLVSRLHASFAARPGEAPTIERAARMLGVSERTLRRRLADEGTGFLEVVNAFRRETAIDCLRTRRMKPKEVGYLLGFRHTSDFRRAFKTWTGHSIGEFIDEPDAA